MREVIWGLWKVSGCPSGLNQGLRLFTMSLREVAGVNRNGRSIIAIALADKAELAVERAVGG